MILSKCKRQATAVMTAATLAAAAASPALAQDKTQEQLLVKRAAQLREAPGDTARSLLDLPAQTALTRVGDRQGAWIKVRMADGTPGWVHMFDVASASAGTQGGGGSNVLRGITGFFNRGSAQGQGSTVTTSTLGIRGLDAEDLARSQPNMTAVTQIDGMRVDANQARQFAQRASLASRPVEPLPAATASTPAGGSNSDSGSR